MKKIILNTALFFFSVMGVVGVFTMPASASWSQCNNGWFCAWNAAGGSGTPWQYSFSPVNTCRVVPPSQWGTWSSVWNRIGSGLRVNIYNNSSCALGGGNRAVTIQNNQQVNLIDIGFNNQNIAMKVI
jgi:hypothetical protein